MRLKGIERNTFARRLEAAGHGLPTKSARWQSCEAPFHKAVSDISTAAFPVTLDARGCARSFVTAAGTSISSGGYVRSVTSVQLAQESLHFVSSPAGKGAKAFPRP